MEHKPLLMGYWNNDRDVRRDGHQYGRKAANLDLIDMPEEYNVITVSTPYMDKNVFPEFVPHNKSKGEFYEQLKHLTSKGRQVLFNLEGQYFNNKELEFHNGLFNRCNQDEVDLANRIMNTVVTNEFSGICLDLEKEIIDKEENQVLIPAALKVIKDWYKKKDRDFIICIASYFLDLLNGRKSLPYLAELEGYYDLVWVKLYDSVPVVTSIRVDEIEGEDWISEDDDEQKEEFLYYIMDSLANGTRGYPKIPHDKLVMGLPANQDAALKGHVKDPSAVLNALERLKKSGTPIRGLAAHSINWDAGHDKDGQPYSYEFINRYKDIVTPV